MLRDGQVAGVLIVIWQLPVEAVPDALPPGCCGCSPRRPRWRSSTPGCARASETLALTDALTGVATRRVFEDELPRELARARRSEYPVAVAMLDLDHLGAFNMLRGEREGDRLIKEAAALVAQRAARGRPGRAGSRAASSGSCCRTAGSARRSTCSTACARRTPRDQTASAGVARWDGEEPSELLQARCDDALAAAKQAGRNVTIAAE